MPEPTIYVVCEGPTDKRVLEPLLTGKLGLFVQVKVAEGKARSVRAYLEQGGEATGHVIALSIEDRDFLSHEDVDEGWQDEKGKALRWPRHEIENYLLEPKVVAHAFKGLREADEPSVARRYAGLPVDEDVIAELLREAARKLFEDHAARIVEWELYTSAGRGNPSTFRPGRPRTPPGAIAPGRAEWLPPLHEEAKRVQAACVGVANLEALLPPRIEERYDAELRRLDEPGFLEQSAHLSEMGGKELMGALRVELSTRFGAQLSAAGLTDVLIAALNEVYEPGRVFAPDDFASLAARLRQLAAAARS